METKQKSKDKKPVKEQEDFTLSTAQNTILDRVTTLAGDADVDELGKLAYITALITGDSAYPPED